MVRSRIKRVFRLSLRSLILIITLLCVFLGIKVEQVRRQRNANAWVVEVQGRSVIGCKPSQPNAMLTPHGLPEDRSEVHPWIDELLDKDIAGVGLAIRERISKDASPELAPLIACVSDFVPCRVECSNGIGYVLCVKRSAAERPPVDVTDCLYIAQPLPPTAVEDRVAYFDASVASLMRDFFTKFSGCGEEMEGHAGQFVFNHWASADEIAYYEPEKLGEWKNSRLLYSARNGDSVFISRDGATAWHVFETNDIVPIFESFADFIRHYAEFRKTSEVFDSWESRDSLGLKPWG